MDSSHLAVLAIELAVVVVTSVIWVNLLSKPRSSYHIEPDEPFPPNDDESEDSQ